MIPEPESQPPADSAGPARGRSVGRAWSRVHRWRLRDPVVRESVVLGLAVGIFGITFGVLAADSQLSTAKAVAMSSLVFTGASQFTAVSVIAAGGTPLTALVSALLLAMRNGVYALSLAPRISARGPRRAIAAQLVIDESTAMAVAHEPEGRGEIAFWWTGLSVVVAWNIGTFLGVVVGNALGDPSDYGLDAAFPAGFISLILPQLRDRTKLTAAVLAAAIAACAIPLVRPGLPVLLAAPAALVALATTRQRP